MNKNNAISIILPVYNEEDNIGRVLRETADYLQEQNFFKEYEIIAVDDGSKDATADILRKNLRSIPPLKVVTHHRSLGYGPALISGVKTSRHPLVFFMDADGQFNISDIGKLLFYIEQFDIITGYRHKRRDSFIRMALGRIYSRIVFLLFGLKLKDINCGFKLVKREIIERADMNAKAGVFYSELFLKAVAGGCTIKQLPVQHFPRLKGRQTGASLRVIFNAITDLIRLKRLGAGRPGR